MKKKVTIAALVAAATMLTAAPLTGAVPGSVTTVPVQASIRYNDSEYALMAFLALDDSMTAQQLAKNKPPKDGMGMTLTQKGNHYTIGFGAHDSTMIVNSNDVTVLYDAPKSDGSGMGDKNAAKTYSKASLARRYGHDKSYFDTVIANYHLSMGTGQNVPAAKVSKTAQLGYETITPMETAAAITYYRQPRMFNDALKAGGMNLTQGDSSDVDEPGNGIMFSLIPKKAQQGDFSYTVDRDGQVYFYGAGDTHHGSVNLRKVIRTVNADGAVAKVRQLANEIDFQH